MVVDEGFNLEKAICNHGFFMLAPNEWIPSTRTFRRPLRLADMASSVKVSISQVPANGCHLLVHVHDVQSLSSDDQRVLQEQVARMVRISSKDNHDMRDFHRIHAKAKNKGFGRLFRSADLFEDMIKSILLCNTTWKNTLQMSQNLCELQAQLCSGIYDGISSTQDAKSSTKVNKRRHKFFNAKRKCEAKSENKGNTRATCLNLTMSNSNELKPIGNFPSSKELAILGEEFLKNHCRLGYRARHVIQLARLVESGELQLKKLEECQNSKDDAQCMEVYNKLVGMEGIGPFVCANILLCIGVYDKVPADTETVALLRRVHRIRKCCTKTVGNQAREVYQNFAPYQCLAYWFELVEYYEKLLKKSLYELPSSSYPNVTSTSDKKVEQTEKERIIVESLQPAATFMNPNL